MSALYQPRPVMSSQRYSPAPDYIDTRQCIDGDRLPLRESTGNAQLQNFSGMASCYQSPVNLSPSTHPTIQPPVVPSQSLESLYQIQTQRLPPRFGRKFKYGENPLYYWPAFRQYRNRQAHKDTQKDKGGVWRRPELEDAFVDSVLLMPHMGRRKFSMGGKLHGRNMLISEYIFVICVAVLGSKEIFRIDNSNDSIEQMGRKQVSSHMQVVKKFFEDLRCFHFLFPAEEKREPGSTNSDDYYEDEEQESFKSNPVLTALAEGRVPDVKPNYDYFSQLLSLQSSICIRPKTCEIFVSSSSITIRDDTAYDANDVPLDAGSFPHLNKYKNCESSPHVLGRDVLLHEYTQAIDRTTSACVKSVTRRWQKEAPAMYETLDLPGRDEECLLMEMCATVDLHEHAKFPSGSELTGFVEVAISQPGLQNHRWKCVTRLTRPRELQSEDSKRDVYTNESGIHRRGCNDSKPDCECHLRHRQDIHVPFPAVEWASILSMAVEYPDVEHQRKKERRNNRSADGDRKRPELERTNSKRKRTEDEGDAASWVRREPTGSDLLCKVAMYQELWSCAPDSSRWVRQCILFWRFNTTNQWFKYNPVFKPAGTTWRWLTINDPMSRYHQQKALIYPSAGDVNRDSIMSPTPPAQQHQMAARSDTFNAAWETHVGLPHLSGLSGSGNTLTLFDGFAGGLATPPPSASLHGSYPTNSFDASALSSNNGLSFMSSTCSNTTGSEPHSAGLPPSQSAYYDSQTSFTDVKSMPGGVNPYMPVSSSLDLTGHVVYDGSDCNTNVQGWDMQNLEGWAANPEGVHSASSSWASQQKLNNSDGSGIWPSASWGPLSAPLTGGGLGRSGSPRQMKRRRTEMLDSSQLPVSDGW